ncbi:uncharacterized [Tachysurus ichikawai]
MDHSSPPRRSVEPPTGIKHSKGHPTAKRPNACALSHQPCMPHTMTMNRKNEFYSLLLLAKSESKKNIQQCMIPTAHRFLTMTFIQATRSSEQTSLTD